MRRLTNAGTAILSVCLLLCAAPLAAAGQQAAVPSDQNQAGQAQQNPLVLEPIRSGFIIAPDVRVTAMDGTTRTLVGAYGGWLGDSALLIGAGGYWLADHSRGHGMVYGGFVLGWTVPAGRAIRFGARALVGGGEATLSGNFTFRTPADFNHPGMGPGFWWDQDRHDTGTTTIVRQVSYHQGFLIFEPQADLVVRLTHWMRFNVGVGYRLIGNANGAEDRLRGAVGSVGLRFGGGS